MYYKCIGQKFSSKEWINRISKKNSQGLQGFGILAKIGFPNIVLSFFIIFIVLWGSGFDKRTEANKPADGRNFI